MVNTSKCSAPYRSNPPFAIFRPCRSRSAAAYSHQTFPWTICRSVCKSSALWKNGGSDPDAVWPHRSDGSSDEACSRVWGSVHGKGTFGSEFGARHCNQWGLYGVRVLQCRNEALFPNYFGQTCFDTLGLRSEHQSAQMSKIIIIIINNSFISTADNPQLIFTRVG